MIILFSIHYFLFVYIYSHFSERTRPIFFIKFKVLWMCSFDSSAVKIPKSLIGFVSQTVRDSQLHSGAKLNISSRIRYNRFTEVSNPSRDLHAEKKTFFNFKKFSDVLFFNKSTNNSNPLLLVRSERQHQFTWLSIYRNFDTRNSTIEC